MVGPTAVEQHHNAVRVPGAVISPFEAARKQCDAIIPLIDEVRHEL